MKWLVLASNARKLGVETGFNFTQNNHSRQHIATATFKNRATERGIGSRGMASLQRSSPSLQQILLKLYRSEKPAEIDHHLHEFGSVEYHVQSSASDPQHVYLSISTPLLSPGVSLQQMRSWVMADMAKRVRPDIVDAIEPSREGYQLTLRINFHKIPPGNETSIMSEISALKAVILSSQLKQILRNSETDTYQGMYKPIKLESHPREPFFVIKQPQKLVAIFPMRFKETTDVIIATPFFLELMDVGTSGKWSKAPPCTWSPIPPPELMGEPIEDLSTNGGFVSFDIAWRHLRSDKLEKTLWSLLSFHAYVNHHVKTTRGFVQRMMRNRLECLVKVLQKKGSGEQNGKTVKPQQESETRVVAEVDHRYTKRLLSKTKILKQRCKSLSKKIKRIGRPGFRIKFLGFGWFRRRLWKTPKFSSAIQYTKLE